MGLKPGYKQTDIGILPTDWNVGCLGEKALKIGSGITPRGGEKVYKHEGRPFLRSQNVGWGTLILDDIAYIDDETHESFKGTEIELGDVLLNITGASIGRSAVADSRVEKGNVNQHVCIIRHNQAELHPRFLNYFLLSSAGQRQIDSFQAGGNRQGLNFGQIRSFCLPLPSLPEQRAIADALSGVDDLINSLDQLIAKKRDIKQAAMQQLLTGKQRLPGFGGEWEVTRLGELGATYGGLTGKTKADFGNGTAQYLTFLNVMNNTVINADDFESVVVAPIENQNAIVKGDLFFNGSSETPEDVGMCSVLQEEVRGVYLNSFCFGFRLHKETSADGLYLAYFFRSSRGRQFLYSLAQGSTRYNLSKTSLLEVEFEMPGPDEQTAIAVVLSNMDAEIEALKKKRDKIRDLKLGMMQELLTGRTRLL